MSYKNAMAGLPLGGGKGVVLAAKPGDTITDAQLEAFGRAVESLGGRYVTAEDVGMSEASMKIIATKTRHVSGLPVAAGGAGGDPGPYTASGVYQGVKSRRRSARWASRRWRACMSRSRVWAASAAGWRSCSRRTARS